MSQIVSFATGAVAGLDRFLDGCGARAVFLVTGRESFVACGAAAALVPALAGRRVAIFSEFEPNPRLVDVERGLEQFADFRYDVVLAVGGGSALDVAKLIAVLSAQPKAARVHMVSGEAPIERDAVPILAVPTTAGSGSEATHFAAVYVNGAKQSVAHGSMLPRYVVIDPELTYRLPPSITATSGLDALCQAIEALWSVRSTEESSTWAWEAVRLALKHLPQAVHTPSPTSRKAMCRAAHLAGMAINVARTTAPHALSYAMSARFGVPHGHAVALTLGEVLVYNSDVSESDVTDRRGAAHVRKVIGELCVELACADADAARSRFSGLVKSLGLATRLRDIGARTASDRRLLADAANAERLANNPRVLTPEAICRLLQRIA